MSYVMPGRHGLLLYRPMPNLSGRNHRMLTPSPTHNLCAVKASRNYLKKENKIPPSSPLGYMSDRAKPYQIHVKQRSCANVNSLISERAELT